MLRYLLADSVRVLRRLPRWTALAVGIAAACGVGRLYTLLGQFGPPGPAAYASSAEVAAMCTLVVFGVVELLFVFGDDFKARIAQTAIGGGVSRAGVVLGKYAEYVCFTLLDTALLALCYCAAGVAFGTPLSVGTLHQALVYFLVCWAEIASYGSLCLIVMFLTQDVKAGLLVYLSCCFMVLPLLASFLVSLGPLERLNLQEFLMFNALERLKTYLIGGRLNGAAAAVLAGNVAACCLFAVAAYRRRELEF